MNETELKQVYSDLVETIQRAKQYSENNNLNQIFTDAESIIAILAYLIDPMLRAEQDYREKVVEYMVVDSVAKAEAKAKSTEEYRKWKKLEMIYKLAEEQIKMLKKFRDKLQDEYNRS